MKGGENKQTKPTNTTTKKKKSTAQQQNKKLTHKTPSVFKRDWFAAAVTRLCVYMAHQGGPASFLTPFAPLNGLSPLDAADCTDARRPFKSQLWHSVSVRSLKNMRNFRLRLCASVWAYWIGVEVKWIGDPGKNRTVRAESVIGKVQWVRTEMWYTGKSHP